MKYLKRTYNNLIKGVLVLLICLVSGQTNLLKANDDSPLIQAGKSNLLQSEFDQAIIKFSEYLKVFGYNSEAYYWRAHALLQIGELDAAITDLNLVLQRYPNDAKALDAMGYAQTQKGNYEQSIKWFNKAIEQNNKSAIFYNNRGMAFYYLENFVTAFNDFNKAVKLDSTFAQAYSNRGSARYNHQDIKKASEADLLRAEKDFSKALELDDQLISAYRNRGIVRYEMQNYRDCFVDFQKAIYLDPEDPFIYFHMGNLMFAKEDYAAAITYYNHCLNRKPNHKEVLYKRALTYELMDKYDLARYDYEIIIAEYEEEKPKGLYQVARTYAIQQDGFHAHYYLNQARKLGLFKGGNYTAKLFKEDAFTPYWQDENFSKLKTKIEKK